MTLTPWQETALSDAPAGVQFSAVLDFMLLMLLVAGACGGVRGTSLRPPPVQGTAA